MRERRPISPLDREWPGRRHYKEMYVVRKKAGSTMKSGGIEPIWR
jgi:hypothetical protein